MPQPIQFCNLLHLGQVYLPESMAYAILAAMVLGLVIAVSLIFAVYKLFRRFDFSRFKSVFLSVIALSLVTVSAWVGILAWNRPRSSTGPSEFDLNGPPEAFYEREMEEAMRGPSVSK